MKNTEKNEFPKTRPVEQRNPSETEFLELQKNKIRLLYLEIDELARIYASSYGLSVSKEKILLGRDILSLKNSIQPLRSQPWRMEKTQFLDWAKEEKDEKKRLWIGAIIAKLYEDEKKIELSPTDF